MSNVMYVCGKCGFEVNKDESVCPRCGARLGDIKCPYCKFTGTPKDFKNDKCPKCGRKNILSIGPDLKNNNKIIKNNNAIDKKKSSDNYYKDDFDNEPFFIKYFKIIFIFLILVVFGLLWFFLKYFIGY